MPKIKVYLDIGLCGCEKSEIIDFDDEVWNSLTDIEKEDNLQAEAEHFMSNNLDYGAYILEDEENDE